MKTKFLAILAIFAMFLTFQACDDDVTDPDDGQARVRVLMTDDPFPADMVKEANIVVERVELRSVDTNNGEDFIVLSTEVQTLNLVDLQNGITATLASEEVPHGNYNQIRLLIKDASIKLTDDRVFDLKVPSGSSSGLKIFITPQLVVQGDLTYDIILDFDLSRSFVVKGNPDTPAGIKGFNFKPVIRATNNTTAGSVTGDVTNEQDEPVDNAFVWIESQGDTLATALTDTTGMYKIIGVPSGNYNIYVEKDTYIDQTASISIVAGNLTRQDFILIAE